MPLDRQVESLLQAMAQTKSVRLFDMPLKAARDLYRVTSQSLDLTNIPVGQVQNHSIETDGMTIPVRLYTPVGAGPDPLPLVIYFHGGGFVFGDLETHDATCRYLVSESGMKILAVDYRLAPEHPFPAALEDAYASVVWAEKNASDLGVDANRLAVGGDSAGACLAAQVCIKARDEKGPQLGYQLLIYPITDFAAQTESRKRLSTGYVLEQQSLDWFNRQYIPPHISADDPCVSPLRFENLTKLPPAYILTAEFDPLVDEAKAYADRLDKAGVDVTYIEHKGMIHGFCNMTGVIEEAKVALRSAAEALKKVLGSGAEVK